MEKADLEKLTEYRNFLSGEIKKMERLSHSESILGSVSADTTQEAYESARKKLYRLFPELKPRQ
jgi:hypothetical protein